MTHSNKKLWLRKQELMFQQDEINSLREELDFERICNQIERVLHKKEYDKLYDTTLKISRDFMDYCESHPSESDSDDDDDEFETPEGCLENGISLTDFCEEYNWNAEKVQEIQEVFRI